MDFKHILVPTDFGEPSVRAVNLGIELAAKFEAKLTLFHAYEVPLYAYPQAESFVVDLFTSFEQAAREQLNSTLASVQQKLPQAKSILRSGVPWREIFIAFEEARADLIVMVTHGRLGFSHAL